MTVSKNAAMNLAKAPRRKEPAEGAAESTALQMGELSELLGYSLKRAQLKVFEDFLHCVAPLQLTPAQFSVLLLLEKNPGRNQTEIANTLGILGPNFVAMLDGLESIATKLGPRMPSVLAISVWLRPGFFSSSSRTENCAGVSCSGATQRRKSSNIFSCARLSE